MSTPPWTPAAAGSAAVRPAAEAGEQRGAELVQVTLGRPSHVPPFGPASVVPRLSTFAPAPTERRGTEAGQQLPAPTEGFSTVSRAPASSLERRRQRLQREAYERDAEDRVAQLQPSSLDRLRDTPFGTVERRTASRKGSQNSLERRSASLQQQQLLYEQQFQHEQQQYLQHQQRSLERLSASRKASLGTLDRRSQERGGQRGEVTAYGDAGYPPFPAGNVLRESASQPGKLCNTVSYTLLRYYMKNSVQLVLFKRHSIVAFRIVPKQVFFEYIWKHHADKDVGCGAHTHASSAAGQWHAT